MVFAPNPTGDRVFKAILGFLYLYGKGGQLSPLRYSPSVKLIANRLLPSRACFLLGFTMIKI